MRSAPWKGSHTHANTQTLTWSWLYLRQSDAVRRVFQALNTRHVADGGQRIAVRRRGDFQGANEVEGGASPLLAKEVQCGDGCGLAQRDSSRKQQAAPSSDHYERQNPIPHNKLGKKAVMVATRAAVSRCSGEESYNHVMLLCFVQWKTGLLSVTMCVWF